MSELHRKPDNPYKPGMMRLRADDLNAIVRAVIRQIRGGANVNTQYFNDRILVQSHQVGVDLPDLSCYIMQFVVLEEHEEGNYLICSPFSQPNNETHQWIPQKYDEELDQDSKVKILVAKPYHLQKKVWSDPEPVVQIQEDEQIDIIYPNTLDVEARQIDLTYDGQENAEYEQLERITPGYFPGDIITAVRMATGLNKRSIDDETQKMVDGEPILWIDLNVAARKWDIPQDASTYDFRHVGSNLSCWYAVGENESAGPPFGQMWPLPGITAFPLWTGNGGVVDGMGVRLDLQATSGARIRFGLYSAPKRFRGDQIPRDLMFGSMEFRADQAEFIGPLRDVTNVVVGPGYCWGVLQLRPGTQDHPNIKSVSGSSTGTLNGFYTFTVSAIYADGTESKTSDPVSVDVALVSQLIISWDVFSGAVNYSIYYGNSLVGTTSSTTFIWDGVTFPESTHGPLNIYPTIGSYADIGYAMFGFADDFTTYWRSAISVDTATEGELPGRFPGGWILQNFPTLAIPLILVHFSRSRLG